jgi:predicted small metal-binding protein
LFAFEVVKKSDGARIGPIALESSKGIIILIIGKGDLNMDKMICWNDLGSECTFTACAETEAGLFEKVLEHGRRVHGMKEFSPDFYNKVRASIREGYCDLEDELCQYGECCC